MSDPVAELRSAVEAAASSLRDGAEAPGSQPTLERPPKPEFGDYSTNAAMLLAPTLGEQPRGTAEKLAEELGRSLEGTIEKVEVAGPGFLNLFLSEEWYRRAAGELAAAGDDLGRPAPPRRRVSGSTSSSSRRTRPARSPRRAGGARPWATRSRGSSSSPGTR